MGIMRVFAFLHRIFPICISFKERLEDKSGKHDTAFAQGSLLAQIHPGFTSRHWLFLL